MVEPIFCDAPGCKSPAMLDFDKLPSEQIGASLRVWFKCDAGHQFMRVLPLQSKDD